MLWFHVNNVFNSASKKQDSSTSETSDNLYHCIFVSSFVVCKYVE